MLNAVPCPLCGYDAPEPTSCPHCGLQPLEERLTPPPASTMRALGEGLRAVPVGLGLLARNRGVKRYLIPPFLLTLFVFTLMFFWVLGFLDSFVEAVRDADVSEMGLEEGWLQDTVEWLITRALVVWAAKAGVWLLALLTSYLLVQWTFSIAYEALAGPFLDEIHGRLESRWFGKNPRDAIQRPTQLPASRCWMWSTVAGVPALVLAGVWYFQSGWTAWAALAAAPLCFVAAGALQPEYGKWLRWVVALEGRTLWVSIKASLLAALILVAFLWLKLIPGVGVFLFTVVAGFATAITLLDIPFSRRQWSLSKRLQFVLKNLLAVTGFGVVAGAVFLIPLIGPVVMVPAASVGGLWLIVRLDKNPLRPVAVRMRRADADSEAA